MSTVRLTTAQAVRYTPSNPKTWMRPLRKTAKAPVALVIAYSAPVSHAQRKQNMEDGRGHTSTLSDIVFRV